MRIGLLPFALSLLLTAGAAVADVLVLPEGEPVPEIRLPAKGKTMADVEKQYGEPRVKRPAVGGGSPQQPPITRWDYDGFAVIFEHDRVVDGVIPGAPPKIYNTDELETVAIPMSPAALSAEPAPEEFAPEAPGTEPADFAPPQEDTPASQTEPLPEPLDEPAPAPVQ